MATLQKQGVDISWADLVQLAGAVAVQEAGGPLISVAVGRTYALQPTCSSHTSAVVAQHLHLGRKCWLCQTAARLDWSHFL